MTRIDAGASLTVLFDLFVESKYSRIPVVRGSIDTVVGVVHAPLLDDTYVAVRGRGAFHGSERLQVSTRDPAQAICATPGRTVA